MKFQPKFTLLKGILYILAGLCFCGAFYLGSSIVILILGIIFIALGVSVLVVRKK